jgi:hypothetical protein
MRIWIGIGIFLVILIVAFALFVFRITEAPIEPAAPEPVVVPITDVSATDSYSKGTHTIEGSAVVPTACTTLSATTSSATEGDAQIIRVDLSADPVEGPCLMLPTEADFSVTTEGTSDEAVKIYANGEYAATAQ